MKDTTLRILCTPWLISGTLYFIFHTSAFAQKPDASTGESRPFNFAHDVAPLLYRHCIECHREGGEGPFSLVSYDEAKKHARTISEVVQSGYMPPWKPERGRGPALQGARGLSAQEIAIFRSWSAEGAPPGDLTRSPAAPPAQQGWKLGTPDLIVELSEDFVLPADGKDVYRNFVLPLPLSDTRFVRALEFRPESRLVIHHAALLFDSTSSARALDRADPGPGFGGMEFGDASNPGGHFVGWSPGQVPYRAYPGTAWQVDPGTDLVLQLHLVPSGKPERIRPRAGLYFDASPPTKITTVVQLSELQIEIPAGASHHVVEEMMRVPVASAVLGLYPHAHYLGKDFHVYAQLPDGRQESLLRIPDWDFNWQRDYRLAEPFPLPAGTVLVMRTVFDNSAENPRNPSRPPRRVRGGWNSTDEMSEVAIQLLLSSESDLQQVQRAQLAYAVESAGGVAAYSYQLGVRWQQRGQLAEAERAFRLAVQKDPEHADAHQRLAALAEDAGRMEEALEHAVTAFRVGSASPVHALNLARLYSLQRRNADARTVLEAAWQRDEQHPAVNLELGILAAKEGAAARAETHLRQAVKTGNGSVRAEASRTLALLALARRDEAQAVAELMGLVARSGEETWDETALIEGLPAPQGWVAWMKAVEMQGTPEQRRTTREKLRARIRALGREDWLPLLE